MPHIIEPAASGRAKCRGCKQPIAKGELRFGECLPNPFADGEMTIWFHLDCGALRRPASFMEVLASGATGLEDEQASRLNEFAAFGIAHHRVERIAGAERASSSRAKCRSCREAIKKDDWRIVLEFFEEGMFNPSGYVHTTCASEYFGTTDVIDRITRFGPELSAADIADIDAHLS